MHCIAIYTERVRRHSVSELREIRLTIPAVDWAFGYDRQRQTQTQRQRQTQAQTQNQRDKDTESEADRQTERQRGSREAERQGP